MNMVRAYPILRYNKAFNLDDIWMLLVMFSQHNGKVSLKQFQDYCQRRPRQTRWLMKKLDDMKLITRKKRSRYSDAIKPGPLLKFICTLYNRLIYKCLSETEKHYGTVNWKWMEKYK
jgi:hypothetical protein